LAAAACSCGDPFFGDQPEREEFLLRARQELWVEVAFGREHHFVLADVSQECFFVRVERNLVVRNPRRGKESRRCWQGRLLPRHSFPCCRSALSSGQRVGSLDRCLPCCQRDAFVDLEWIKGRENGVLPSVCEAEDTASDANESLPGNR
jgi:hypothetical protein